MSLMMLYMSGIQQSFHLNQERGVPESMWRQLENSMTWVLEQPGFTVYWKSWSHATSPEFLEWIEARSPSLRSARGLEPAAQQDATADPSEHGSLDP